MSITRLFLFLSTYISRKHAIYTHDKDDVLCMVIEKDWKVNIDSCQSYFEWNLNGFFKNFNL